MVRWEGCLFTLMSRLCAQCLFFRLQYPDIFSILWTDKKNCMRRCLKRLLVPNSKEEYIWTSPIIKCLCSKTNYCTALRSINYIEVISMSSSSSWSSSIIKILNICCHFVLLLWCKWISLGGIHVLELLF